MGMLPQHTHSFEHVALADKYEKDGEALEGVNDIRHNPGRKEGIIIPGEKLSLWLSMQRQTDGQSYIFPIIGLGWGLSLDLELLDHGFLPEWSQFRGSPIPLAFFCRDLKDAFLQQRLTDQSLCRVESRLAKQSKRISS